MFHQSARGIDGVTRRAFLRRVFVVGVAIPTGASLLAACSPTQAPPPAATTAPSGGPTPAGAAATPAAATPAAAATNAAPATKSGQRISALMATDKPWLQETADKFRQDTGITVDL